MILLNVAQGSPEWHAARAKCLTASEAPAMMGASLHMSRSDLVRMKATGEVREPTPWEQERFLAGHLAESAARPIIEARIGEELYPATATDDEGRLLASYDGLTMSEEIGYEHKLWNEVLAAQVLAGELDPAYYWQLEQQLLVCPTLKEIIFVCSGGTEQKMVSLVYRRVPGRAEQLLAGWRQFEEDVRNYRHVEVLPRAVAKATMALPALSIRVDGAVRLLSNLDVFGDALNAFVKGINKEPETDQDFANAENALKVLQKAEDALEAAEASALAQTASIDEMRRAVALHRETARSNRLMLEKLVEAKKASIREQIRTDGVMAYEQYLHRLNERLGQRLLFLGSPTTPATRFPEVMKGKRTIASLRDAVDTEVARVKIAANEVADRVQVNLQRLDALEPRYRGLFPDTANIAFKAADDFAALVVSRVAREDERIAREREQIRQEEEAKARAKVAEEEARRLEAIPRPPAPTPPAPTTLPTRGKGKPAAKALRRPPDDELIRTLAGFYGVNESQVIAWLLEVDLQAARARLSREFAAR